MPSPEPYAYLGMYDFPALRPAADAWWTGLAGHFAELGFPNVPSGLNRSVADPYDIWQAPELFLAQTCGYPLTHRLADKVSLVGTPCYSAPGCDGPLYRSLYVVSDGSAAGDLATALPARVAVNAKDSYSGWRVLVADLQSRGFDAGAFSEVIISGSHAESIDLVAHGRADLAAIDCVTHALIDDVEAGRLVGTRVLSQSPAAPGLPYITGTNRPGPEIQRMATAIQNAFDDPQLEQTRQTLRLADFAKVPLQDYRECMK